MSLDTTADFTGSADPDPSCLSRDLAFISCVSVPSEDSPISPGPSGAAVLSLGYCAGRGQGPLW